MNRASLQRNRGAGGGGLTAVRRWRRAFTLLELLAVITILASVAALVVGNLDTVVEDAEETVARANLSAVREAICGSSNAPGYLADMKHVPGFDPLAMRIHNLLSSDQDGDGDPDVAVYDLAAGRGWRGPYIQRAPGVRYPDAGHPQRFPMAAELRFDGDATFSTRRFHLPDGTSWYGVPHNHDLLNPVVGDLVIGDPWGNPIVIQIPPAEAFTLGDAGRVAAKRWRYARLVSAGPDGVLSTPRYEDSILDPAIRQTGSRLAGLFKDPLTGGTLTTARGDDLVLFLNRADVYEDEEP